MVIRDEYYVVSPGPASDLDAFLSLRRDLQFLTPPQQETLPNGLQLLTRDAKPSSRLPRSEALRLDLPRQRDSLDIARKEWRSLPAARWTVPQSSSSSACR